MRATVEFTVGGQGATLETLNEAAALEWKKITGDTNAVLPVSSEMSIKVDGSTRHATVIVRTKVGAE